jgi:hypothetical protein
MAEDLLKAYREATQQHQQQQQGGPDGAGSSAAAATAAGGDGDEGPPLPKEAFVLQLVRACCGTAGQPLPEKVVVFSQVRDKLCVDTYFVFGSVVCTLVPVFARV